MLELSEAESGKPGICWNYIKTRLSSFRKEANKQIIEAGISLTAGSAQL